MHNQIRRIGPWRTIKFATVAHSAEGSKSRIFRRIRNNISNCFI
jgi:hypothetical protein